MSDLVKLKEAAEKATSGQWRMSPWHIEEGPPCVRLLDEPSHIVATTASDTDAAYIALANPSTILALLERLRETEQSAARIEALEAENERLREALKPFAAARRVFGDKSEPALPDGHAYNLSWNMDEGRCDFTLGQFRRARAALAGKEPT